MNQYGSWLVPVREPCYNNSMAPVKKSPGQKPITRSDLDKFKNDIVSTLTTQIQANSNQIREVKNDLVSFKDEILKGQENLRTDKLMLISRDREQGEQLENHEERIVILEKKVLV